MGPSQGFRRQTYVYAWFVSPSKHPRNHRRRKHPPAKDSNISTKTNKRQSFPGLCKLHKQKKSLVVRPPQPLPPASANTVALTDVIGAISVAEILFNATMNPASNPPGLEDAVHDVAANRRASTEDSRIPKPESTLANIPLDEKRGGNPQKGENLLLAKLLPVLLHLATASLVPLVPAPLRNRHGRHVRVIRVHRRLRPLVMHHGPRRLDRRPHLLLLDLHVVAREDALRASPEVAAHPPVGVHVLVHRDLVVALEAEVARVRASVPVQRARLREHGLGGRRRRRRLLARGQRGGPRLVVRGRRGRVRGARGGDGGGRGVVGAGGAAVEGRLVREEVDDVLVAGVVEDALFHQVLEFLENVSVRPIFGSLPGSIAGRLAAVSDREIDVHS